MTCEREYNEPHNELLPVNNGNIARAVFLLDKVRDDILTATAVHLKPGKPRAALDVMEDSEKELRVSLQLISDATLRFNQRHADDAEEHGEDEE